MASGARGGLGYWLARGEYEREVSYRVVQERRFDQLVSGNETWWAQQQLSADTVVLHGTESEGEFERLYGVFSIG